MIEDLLPLVLFGILGVAAITAMISRWPDDERRWLMRVLLAAYALRIGFATLFAMVPGTRMFHDDASGYEAIGVGLAHYWHGSGPPIHPEAWMPQNYGFYYGCGALYFVFGAFRAVPSYFNSLIGTVTVLLVYSLARRFFHVLVARRAALLTAFIPSMILWSALAIKDPFVTFLVVLCLHSCIRLKERLSFGAIVGTVLPIIIIQPVRFYLVYILSAAVLLSLFLERGSRVAAGFSKQLTVGLALVALLAIAGFSGRAESGAQFFSFERLNTFREGMASTANSGFAVGTDISTPQRALAFLPIGLTMLLFSPFPWQFTSLRASFAFPEMIVWWYLMPSLWRGIRFTLKERFSQVSPVLLFAAILSVVYSFTHGNIGSGFRQRAQIFVFLFIFTSVGQYLAVCKKSGLDEQLLLNALPDGPRPAASAEAAPPVAGKAAA